MLLNLFLEDNTKNGTARIADAISLEIKNDVFEKKNKKRLKNIIDSITLGIYKSQISLGGLYAENIKKIKL